MHHLPKCDHPDKIMEAIVLDENVVESICGECADKLIKKGCWVPGNDFGDFLVRYIPLTELEDGYYYFGESERCGNSARYDHIIGKFIYKHIKFGHEVEDTVPHIQEVKGTRFDGFIPFKIDWEKTNEFRNQRMAGLGGELPPHEQT